MSCRMIYKASDPYPCAHLTLKIHECLIALWLSTWMVAHLHGAAVTCGLNAV